jgi:Fe-S-cluster containining protein
MSVNLKSFRLKLRHHKSRLKRFLSRIELKPPPRLFTILVKLEKQVWKETDCLSCANCCKTMTPTYTGKDMKRIARHLDITVTEFKRKWLKKDKVGDWMNKNTPCQFLDSGTNRCTIYAVRPGDCRGFPHLTKRKVTDYIHVHKANIDSCPATFKMVEKLMKKIKGE